MYLGGRGGLIHLLHPVSFVRSVGAKARKVTSTGVNYEAPPVSI